MDNEYVLSGRYALKSHLARGGMAEVYVAQDRLLGRQVAVKILHDQFAADDAFVERFRREAMAAAALSHPNIVGIYDWGHDDDTYYMVMELIKGRNLRDVLRTEGALLPRRVGEIGMEVAAALQVAHDAGLVHRDIKPANVLLTPDGSVKVTDFGIARAWNDSEELTRTGAVIGTATYFSPEQAQGLTADSRSDLYALGVVMYELLTGRPPFSGESPVSVAYQHVREVPVVPSALNPEVPAVFDAVIMKCLHKSPESRYQSAAELAADLRRLLAGQVPAAAPENEAPTQVMAAVGPVTGAPSTPPPAQPPPPASYQEGYDQYDEPDRTDRTTMIVGILGAVAMLGIGLILLIRLLGPQSAAGLQVEIPELGGVEKAAAAQELRDLGLQVQEQEIPDAQIPVGQVVRTDPPAGTTVDEGSTVTLFVSSGPAQVDIPRVIGEDLLIATATLENLGLVVETEFEPSETIDQDIVISQTPEPGQTVATGTIVRLIVSAGTDTLEVPDVANRSERDALLQLEEAGFTPGQIRVEREPSKDVLQGFVIETDPPAGGVVPASGIIRVIISDGAVPTVVPNVVGKTPSEARIDLEELGFEVATGEPVELPFGDEENGKVAEQNPRPGEVADFGSTVTLRIGQSADTIDVPDVVGDTPTTARREIEDAGLTFARGDDVLLEPGDPEIGDVVEQSPPAGTVVDPGRTVTVRVGVEGARVPDVTSACMTPANAQAAIQAAGLVYRQAAPAEVLPYGDPCDGDVVEQSPGPYSVTNQLVDRGTVVTVRIGEAEAGVAVPNVIGDPRTTAREKIEGAGLVYAENLPPGDVGTATDQDPNAGTEVARGSTVTVTFAAATTTTTTTTTTTP